jgi:hypothetical protein
VKEMFPALLRVDAARWRSIEQVEEMRPLSEFCKDGGE